MLNNDNDNDNVLYRPLIKQLKLLIKHRMSNKYSLNLQNYGKTKLKAT